MRTKCYFIKFKMATEDIVKHSVHTLVFRSLKRTHDFFLHDHALPLSKDETSERAKIACKVHDEYSSVKDMVQIKDNTDKPRPHSDNKSNELASILPSPRTSAHQAAARSKALVAAGEGGGTKQQPSTALMHQKKAPLLPKPQWHAPWKLMRVVSGHTGWVRSVTVEPGNQWFATGSADRTIKVLKVARPSNSGAIPPNFEPKTLEDEESYRKSIIDHLLQID